MYERGWVHTYRRWRTHTARGVRTPPTVRVHPRTLTTVSLHLVSLHLRMLTHRNQRLGTVWRDCDAWRRCVYAHHTSRRNAYTRGDGQRRCVHTKVWQPTHLQVFMRHYESRAHMISSIGFIHAGPCACSHISHWFSQYSISISIYIRYIYFIASLFHVV